MRIAILHGSNDTYGATRVLIQEISCLVNVGHTVVVVVPQTGPLAHEISQAGLEATVIVDPGLAVLRRSNISDLLHPIRLRPEVVDADLVVIWTLALAVYIPLLRAKRKNFYVSVHELLLSRVGNLLVRALLAPGRFPICACSEATATWLERNGVARSRLTVTSPVFEPVTTVEAQAPHDPLTIAVVGRVNGHKGHLEVVRALQSLSPETRPACPPFSASWRLLLFGAPFPGQEAALDAVLDLIAGDARIEYRGEAASVAAIAGEIDAVACFPSTPEPFGLVPVEAWRVGVRAIGFADGGAGEVLPIVGGIGVARSGAPVSDIVSALERLEQSIRARTTLPTPSTVNPKFSLERRLMLLTRVVTQAGVRSNQRTARAN
ncbi:Glycosyltransferase involved in cell wall bisynthesis [Cryobacterium flavum]|uniref:Glycosyltransferase n=1 Tax=Cryobacterium flavum TaxID=1424659 RepID=A0A4R8V8N2_9MICO|nr:MULTISPECIES: glycosyltransferase family 4 protein [Cryobacterium]TFB78283.1 glycosyltransferase [Cryobacterium flavum]TFB78545.1 glycosyltransferase [Cryobacterium flavum]SDO36521.1 Glycosyltransferase involved in cell wall bisynthesis [Cryobacterium flavum]